MSTNTASRLGLFPQILRKSCPLFTCVQCYQTRKKSSFKKSYFPPSSQAFPRPIQLTPSPAVTGSFIPAFGLASVLLSLNVVRARLSSGTYHGESTSKDNQSSDPLFLANRVHANFTESVPVVLLLASIVEINGGDRKYLSYALAAFGALRAAHAVGLGGAVIDARRIGYFGTQAFTALMAGWSVYLSKSYWGF